MRCRSTKRRNLKIKIPPWCWDKIKRTNHFYAKAQNCDSIVANWAILHVCASKQKNKKREQTKNVNDDDDYEFVMCNEAHSKKMYNWIMDSGEIHDFA